MGATTELPAKLTRGRPRSDRGAWRSTCSRRRRARRCAVTPAARRTVHGAACSRARGSTRARGALQPAESRRGDGLAGAHLALRERSALEAVHAHAHDRRASRGRPRRPRWPAASRARRRRRSASTCTRTAPRRSTQIVPSSSNTVTVGEPLSSATSSTIRWLAPDRRCRPSGVRKRDGRRRFARGAGDAGSRGAVAAVGAGRSVVRRRARVTAGAVSSCVSSPNAVAVRVGLDVGVDQRPPCRVAAGSAGGARGRGSSGGSQQVERRAGRDRRRTSPLARRAAHRGRCGRRRRSAEPRRVGRDRAGRRRHLGAERADLDRDRSGPVRRMTWSRTGVDLASRHGSRQRVMTPLPARVTTLPGADVIGDRAAHRTHTTGCRGAGRSAAADRHVGARRGRRPRARSACRRRRPVLSSARP